MSTKKISRRTLLGTTAAAGAFTIVPRHVLGGPGRQAPSDTVTGALVGCGSRGRGSWSAMGLKSPRMLAKCDVDKKHVGGEPDKKTRYRDFRYLMERKDIDVICIATPPHWHALVCIAAAQAGKDIFCEKPMTKFIAEGRAVVNAVKRYGRIFQIGTFGRFRQARTRSAIEIHKIMKHGLLKDLSGVVCRAGVPLRVGKTFLPPQPVPPQLDYDLWLGPAPYKPYHPHRVHYSNRFYWDYEGGDLTNFGAHRLDPFTWTWAKDDTGPVEVTPHAPWPQHPDAVGRWGWVELKYADGLTLVIETGKWGKRYDSSGKRSSISAGNLDDRGRKKLAQIPDEGPLVSFAEAIKTRKQAGGHAEAAHRGITVCHLANIAIRLGRKLRWDPVNERCVGDDQANALVDIPMRAPWHL